MRRIPWKRQSWTNNEERTGFDRMLLLIILMGYRSGMISALPREY